MKEWKRYLYLAAFLALIMVITVIPMQNAQAATIKLSKSNIQLSKTSYYYTGSACKPKVTVKCGKKVLKNKKDYTYSYSKNVTPGTAVVTVKGKGKYSGTVSKSFKIKNALSVSLSKSSYTYSGNKNNPSVTVKSGKKKLSGKYYSVTYKNNVNAGTASIIVKGKGKYKGKNAYVTYKIGKKSIDKMSLILSEDSFTYTGEECKPTVTVNNGSASLKNGTDYTVSYNNNIGVGSATVTVEGKGNYTGYLTGTFTINEKEQDPEFNLPDKGLMVEGDRFTLSVTGGKEFTFSTSNSQVVRIEGEKSNVLYANGAGSVTITAKCGDIELTRSITVARVDMNSPKEMMPGDSYKINKSVYGADASLFTFESSNTSIATVDRDGAVYAVPGAGGEVEIALLADTISGRSGKKVKINVKALASLFTVEKTGKTYQSVTEAATNNMTTGQASDVRLFSYEMGSCDANGFYYNNQIATVKQGEYDYYFVADTWNNRVMIYRTTGGAVWDNNTEPYRVLGQSDFTDSTSLTKNTLENNLAKMNWPVGVAACVVENTIRIFVTDTNNDRILVWNDLPESNGASADFAMYHVVAPDTATVGGEDNSIGYINQNATEIAWPWAIWTNGERLICTDTRASRVLIWDGLPTDATDYPDTVVFTGASSTPRSIISDGDYLIVGDHNIGLDNGSVSQGYHVYDSVSALLTNGSYQSNAGDLVCTKEQVNPGGIILDKDLLDASGNVILKSGTLMMTYGGSIKVFASEDGNTRKLTKDGEEPDYYVGGGSPDEPMGYYFVGADCQQIIVDSNGNLYTTLFNQSMVVGYKNGTFPKAPAKLTQEQIDARESDSFRVDGMEDAMYFYRSGDSIVEAHSTIRPNLSVGVEPGKIDVSASNARYHYQNCIPDTKNGYMVVSCDHPLGTNLMLYKNVPDESGAIPDTIMSFGLTENVAYAKLFANGDKTGVIAGGKSTLFIWEDINEAIEGNAPGNYMRNKVGSVSTEGTAIYGFDYVEGYFIVAIGDKVYVFEGFPVRDQKPLKTITFPSGTTHDIRGKKTSDGTVYVSFTGRERGIRIVELSEILGKEGNEFASSGLSGYVDELGFDLSVNGEDRTDNRDFEATATYITDDGHVISIVGFCQIWIWDSVADALAGETYAIRLGLGDEYYCMKNLNANSCKTDYMKIQSPTTLFMPTNITYDERGYLWVADYKFAGGIRRFKGKV